MAEQTGTVAQPIAATSRSNDISFGPRSRWGWKVVLWAALVCHVALAWSGRSPGLLTGQDDAEYILLGRALSHGSYRESWRIDTPLHSQYPPVYPALLALTEALGGQSYDLKLAFMMALSATMLLLLHGALRRRLGDVVAICSVVALAVNPVPRSVRGRRCLGNALHLLRRCVFVLPDPADDVRPESQRTSNAWLTAAAATAILAALTRTVGVSLLGAVCVWTMYRRQTKATVFFAAACAISFGGWLVWTMLAPEQFVGRSYIADALDTQNRSLVSTLVGRIVSNVSVYATASLPFLLSFPTIPGTGVDNAVVLLILAVTLVAGTWTIANAWPAAALFLAAYMSILAVYRWQFTRFLVPMVVILVPLLLAGTMSVAAKLRPALRAACLLSMTAVIVFGGAQRSWELTLERGCNRSRGIPLAECTTPEQANYFDALRFIQSNLPADAVLLTAKSGPLYHYVARKSIGVEAARSQRPEEFLAFLINQGVDHILLASLEGIELRYFGPLLQANCERLQLVKSFTQGTLLFSTKPATVSSREGDACGALAEYRAFNASRKL